MPVPENIRPVGRTRTREIIADRLREWIVEGRLAPGEDIRDVQIAASLGVSRTPVREALLQLEREGLILMQPQGWTRVAPLDIEQWEHLHALWVELHVFAARLAAGCSHQDDLQAVEAAAGDMRAAIERAQSQDDFESALAITDADDTFHEAIVAATGNTYLADTLRPLNVLVRRFQSLHYRGRTAIGGPSAAEHEDILDALRRGDAAAAADLMRRNVGKAFPGELGTATQG